MSALALPDLGTARAFSSSTPLDLLTLDEAAQLAGLTRETLLSWCKRGKITLYGAYGKGTSTHKLTRVSWSQVMPPVDPACIPSRYGRLKPTISQRRKRTALENTLKALDETKCQSSNAPSGANKDDDYRIVPCRYQPITLPEGG